MKKGGSDTTVLVAYYQLPRGWSENVSGPLFGGHGNMMRICVVIPDCSDG